MGKIFKALEKYQKEREGAVAMSPLMSEDRDVLQQYNKNTGKLDLNNRKIVKDPATVQRLLANHMIYPDGKLTSAGIKLCGELHHGVDPSNASSEAMPDQEPMLQDSAEILKIESRKSGEAKKVEEKISALQSEPVGTIAVEEPDRHKPLNLVPVKDTSGYARYEKNKDQSTAIRAQSVENKDKGVDKSIVALTDPMSFEAEQFKILRTNILFPVTGNAPRSILVTSSVPGEGKSFVAANLAVSIAQEIDRYVLLVDCDLRRPRIHRQFGLGNVRGLSDYLTDGEPLSDLLQSTTMNKLSILPAGKKTHNPAELLSSERMKALLTEVTNRYSDRLIIIDTPPPKLTAEANFLARQVDGILLVIDYGKTQQNDLRELIQKMGKDKILGSVINRFNIRSWSHRGYRKQLKYGSHYYDK